MEQTSCMYVLKYNEGSSLLSIHPHKFLRMMIIIKLKFKLCMRFLNKYEHVAFPHLLAQKSGVLALYICISTTPSCIYINYMIFKKHKTFFFFDIQLSTRVEIGKTRNCLQKRRPTDGAFSHNFEFSQFPRVSI